TRPCRSRRAEETGLRNAPAPSPPRWHNRTMRLIHFRSIPPILCLLLAACSSLQGELRRDLRAGRAVEGDIHGAYPDLDLYVLTYRDPENFFESVDVSLVAGNSAVEATLAD